MIDYILSFIFLYKYFALFVINFFASFLNIAPATLTLIASGSLIAKGHLDYTQAFLFAYFGSVFADIVSYFLSYKYGKEVLVKMGFKKMINSPSFEKAEKIFHNNAGKTIFFSRFVVPSLGPVVNIIAGLSKINYKKFIFYSLLGKIMYIFLFIGIGYVFVNSWNKISNFLDYINVILIVVIILIIYQYLKKKNIINKKIVI